MERALGTDEYERRYMDAGRAIARERTACPPKVHLLCGLLVALTTVPALLAGPWLWSVLARVPPGLALATAAMWLVEVLFAPLYWLSVVRIRTSVTASFVRIDWGACGSRIPVDAIRDARVGRASEVRFWVYGAGERGLVLVFARGERERAVFVQSERPERLVAAIAEARGGRVCVADGLAADVAEAAGGPEERGIARLGGRAG